MEQHQQWALLKRRNFLPLFLTQFLGAFNDNVFKNALVILLTFNSAILPSALSPVVAVNISAALFILPYFVFSAVAGQMADFKEKSSLMFKLKILELVLMLTGSIALWKSNVYMMWLVLFGLGSQAAFFGPLKYSILPQHLHEKELIGGNALIESGTFLAILLGTILGGLLVLQEGGSIYICGVIVVMSMLGCISAYMIPRAPAMVENQRVSFNIWQQSKQVLGIARKKKAVFQSILAISWFWFLGATLLSQFPSLVKDVIGGKSAIVTVFLTIFSIGIVIGSLLCEKLSSSKLEIGLVPFGAFGMVLFGLDLCWALEGFVQGSEMGVSLFLESHGSWRILLDLFLLSVFGGFFTVPLYAYIQNASAPEERSRIIGANNILNAIFMVGSAIFSIAVVKLGGDIITILWAMMVLHIAVSLYVFSVVPEFLMRFIVWMLTHLSYNIKKEGLHHVPEEGPALIVCNHISFVDALIIFGCIRRPVKFVMNHRIFNIFFLKPLFKAVGAVPIASKKDSPEVLDKALSQIHAYLEKGELVVIFPEGGLTTDGEIAEFRPGFLKIAMETGAPVLPSALSGLWSSMFSRKTKRPWNYFPVPGRRIAYVMGEPLNIKGNLCPEDVKDIVKSLRKKP